MAIVTLEDEQELVYDLSDSIRVSDFERPLTLISRVRRSMPERVYKIET